MPKTGTKSLERALKILGYEVHDFKEHLDFHMDEYTQALEGGKMPGFEAMYKDVDAVTDAPACFFFEEIFKAFPESKVVLSEREDDEVWRKSYMHTYKTWLAVTSRLWVKLGFLITPTGRRRQRFNVAMLNMKLKNFDEKLMKQVYNDHNARAKAVIPKGQLLEYNVKEGWEPLCKFLGVEVPNVPFPHLNAKSGAIKELFDNVVVNRKMFREVIVFCVMVILALAAFAFYFVTQDSYSSTFVA